MSKRENDLFEMHAKVICMSKNDFNEFCRLLKLTCESEFYANFICLVTQKRKQLHESLDI